MEAERRGQGHAHGLLVALLLRVVKVGVRGRRIHVVGCILRDGNGQRRMRQMRARGSRRKQHGRRHRSGAIGTLAKRGQRQAAWSRSSAKVDVGIPALARWGGRRRRVGANSLSRRHRHGRSRGILDLQVRVRLLHLLLWRIRP
ncbi:hypothetical protein CAOG_009738 [Capsaspora owczarzaki ATCC 30864]|uniref:Uncharacterized protein n=1 Tax=Capsaspora owczarzaki (strain ATCC 30864) TaxID=595528 RepID=A0A0D2UDS4_CAPO3|nr:hypothetical protein CAOG_009738 [Capsaspora owczarzaki ATCC 30864]